MDPGGCEMEQTRGWTELTKKPWDTGDFRVGGGGTGALDKSREGRGVGSGPGLGQQARGSQWPARL